MTSVRSAIAPFAPCPLSTRAHVALRRLSCPFDAVLDELPTKGEILDYGCGHGLLTTMLARSRDVEVLGVDIDPKKIEVARAAAPPRARFDLVEPLGVPDGSWDAIAVVDVLYLLPEVEQKRVIAALAARLRPGAALVVKEMDTRPRYKAAWMRLQEQIVVRLLRVTKGSTLAFTDPAALEDAMRMAGLSVARRRVDRHFPHPHVLIVGRRA